jgi:hypothetical protein
MHEDQLFDFISLAAAHEQGGIGRFALASDPRHGLQTCGFGQQSELFKLAIEMRQAEIDPHQDGGAGGFLGCVVQAFSLKSGNK